MSCPAPPAPLEYPEQLAGRQVADRLSQVMSPRMLSAGTNNGLIDKENLAMIANNALRDLEHVRDPQMPNGPVQVGPTLASSSQSQRSYLAAATAAAMKTHREIGSSSDPLIQSQWRVLEDTSRTPSGFSAQWATTDTALQSSESSILQAVAQPDAVSPLYRDHGENSLKRGSRNGIKRRSENVPDNMH